MPIPIEQRDTQAIKRWRNVRHDAGLPSGYEDFYIVNGYCLTCRGAGEVEARPCRGLGRREAETCSFCRGSGRAVS